MTAEERASCAGATDTGRVREINEDAFLADPPLFAVADGLGGHRAGEIASGVAIEALLKHAPRRADAKALGRAVRAANAAVMEAAGSIHARSGMGTTLTAAMVDGLRVAIAHVGDTRAYLMHRDGGLERLTEDHSMVADLIRQGRLTEEEARFHPNRSIITRALGSDPDVVADTFEITAQPGDRLLLASDGLTGMIRDDHIRDLLDANPEPHAAAQALIRAANAAGGHDNVTLVVAVIGDQRPPVRRHVPLAFLLWVAAALMIVSAGVGGVWWYAHNQAFLIAEHGVVVVYRGVPGRIAGVSLKWRESTTGVRVDDLPPRIAERLRTGVRVDDLRSAERVVRSYEEQALPSRDATGTEE